MRIILIISALLVSLAVSAQEGPRLYSNKKVWGKLIPIEDKRVRLYNRTDSMTAKYITVCLIEDNLATDTTARAVFRVEYVGESGAVKLSLTYQRVLMSWDYYLNHWNSNSNTATISWVTSQIGVTLK